MAWDSVFHEGEREAQRRAGEEENAEMNSAIVSEKMPGGALNFIRQQQMLIVSSKDEGGRRWASALFGQRGFLEPVDRGALRIALKEDERDTNDPLWKNLLADPRLGMLVIDFGTRRRIRINGRAEVAADGLMVTVNEVAPICPKYITRRDMQVEAGGIATSGAKSAAGESLPARLQKQIAAADVMFLATGHRERGNDVSHRGGLPGFVEVVDERTLRFPDYLGNSMFNALGNLLTDDRMGVLLPDFEHGRQVQMTGRARILWDAEDRVGKTGGSHRFVEFTVERWVGRGLAARVHSAVVDYSPFDPVGEESGE